MVYSKQTIRIRTTNISTLKRLVILGRFVEKNDLKDEEENIIENEEFDDKLPG